MLSNTQGREALRSAAALLSAAVLALAVSSVAGPAYADEPASGNGALTASPQLAANAALAAQSEIVLSGGFADSDCTWSLSDEGVLTVNAGTESDSVPQNAFSSLASRKVRDSNGEKLTSEMWEACKQAKTLKLVGVTALGKSAFTGLTGITKAQIPSTVTVINGSSFSGCTALEEIEFDSPINIKEIGDNAFSKTAMKSFSFEGNGEVIFGAALSNCASLESVSLKGVKEITGQFSGCTVLKSIEIGEGCTNLGTRCFENSPALSSVSLPSSLEGTLEGTFRFCTNLASIDISNTKITSISEEAFSGTLIEELVLPATFTEIGNRAFTGMSKLKSLYIGDGVTSAPAGFIALDTALESISVPATLADFDKTTSAYTSGIECDVTIRCSEDVNTQEAAETAFSNVKAWAKSLTLEHTGEAVVDPATAATCTTPAKTEGTHCSHCGGAIVAQEEVGDVDPDAHKYGAWTPLDGEKHQRVCEYDAAHVETADHAWDLCAVTKEATAEADGEITFTCIECGATKTEPITLAEQQALSDLEAAAAVLPATVTADNRDQVAAAVAAYAGLSEKLKPLVSAKTLTALLAAQTQVAALDAKALADEQQKVADLEAAATESQTTIAQLQTTIGDTQKKVTELETAVKESQATVDQLKSDVKAANDKAAKASATLKKAALTSKTKSAKKGKVTVAWKKVAGAAGYQVKVGTKTYTVKKASTLKKTVSIAKSKWGKKVSVKVRAYKKVGNNTLYGPWSKAKSVKVKKK